MSDKANSFAKFLIASVFMLSMASCAVMHGQESSGQYVDDATLTTRVKEAYLGDPTIKPTEIHVETLKGVVELSGFVDSREQERRAVHLAHEIDGVKDVKDNIIVRAPADNHGE